MIEKMFSLKGHTALVTGSSRGIGRACAMALGAAGAQVIFHASADSPRLDGAVAEARAAGIKCCAVTGNLEKVDDIPAMLKSIPGAFGTPDVLVLNASVQDYMHIEEFSLDEFDREMKVNVASGYQLVKELLPAMESKKWGRIIAIGSVNQWKQAPRLTVYSATKCAQLAMILSLARSHAGSGVTFNNVAPGVVATDRNAVALSNRETVERLMDAIPARRFGEPEDIAGTVLLLASDAGAYINGADIPVTGGMHL